MANIGDQELYLNRRSDVRVAFQKSIRFHAQPEHPVRGLEKAISQNISLRGMQVLAPVILERKKPFDVWIPIEGHNVLRAKARTCWVQLESTLADSPYWLRAGVSLQFPDIADRRVMAKVVAKKAQLDLALQQETESKISFVF